MGPQERQERRLAAIFAADVAGYSRLRVTEAIVGAIEPTITLSEIERAKRKRPDNLDG